MRKDPRTPLFFAFVLAGAGCGDGGSGRGSASGTDSSATSLGTATATTSADTESGGTTGTSQGSDSAGSSTSGGSITATAGGSSTSGGSTTSGTGSTGGTTGAVCPQGEIVCEGDTAKVCDGMGGFESEEPCPDVCVDGIGCKFCVPGSSQCNGDTVETCDPNGDMFVPTDTCDPLQGQTCDPQFGACTGACSKNALGLSYIGCDYYPTVTQQDDSHSSGAHVFAVAVANTSGMPADITVTQGANTVDSFQVPAGSVVVRTLPWVNALCKGYGPSTLVADGAYRLRSTQPVTVYQYNPLAAAYSNDASLLLPVNAWGSDYVVASFYHWVYGSWNYPGFYAVVASEDGTTVNLAPSATGNNIKAGGGVAANGTGQVTLDQGDVLQVITNGGDVTGTRVSADKPIQVISGHKCTFIPSNVGYCDHLEEAVIPVDALAKEYFVAPPVHPSNPNAEKGEIVRIVATEPNTTLSYDPPQGGLPGTIANAGDFAESPIGTTPFKVTADKKILVLQFMVGQDAGYGLSDPAMVQAVPAEQFRQDYLFHAATNWVANFVDVIAPDGASVTVDGNAVPAASFKPIGGTGWSWAHVQLSNGGNGNHTVTADQGVGISVYGVQSYGSYWYPGGLDLSIIPQ